MSTWIYLSLEEHIYLPFLERTHRFTFLWTNTLIYLSLEEHINLPFLDQHIDLPFPGSTHLFTFLWMKASIYLSLDEHIDLPFSGWTHWFTFLWMNTSIYLSRDEWIIVTCSTSCHQCQSSEGVEIEEKGGRGSTPWTKRTPDDWIQSLLLDILEQLSQYKK